MPQQASDELSASRSVAGEESRGGEAPSGEVESAVRGSPGGGRRRRLKRALVIALAGLLFCAASGALAFYLVIAHFSEGLPSVEALKAGYDPPQTSRILAADGTLLSNVFTERRTVIPFGDIPPVTKLAFLAAEDARFYEHEGLNYLGIVRAMWANLRAGGIVQGGSTITQQVVKIILLDQTRNYRRKLQDAILAHRLEKYLTKDEIFSLYLNHITMGHGRYGIEEAARYYFGKPASKLDANESATIAGIVPSPERYSPRRSPERALTRRNFVLQQMLAKGFIAPEFQAELLKSPLPPLALEADTQSTLCPEAVDAAKKALAQARKEVGSPGGYSVTTTIRPELQLAARQAVRQALDEYGKRHGLQPPYQSKAIKAWGKPFKGTPRPNRIYVGVVRATDDASGVVEVQVGDVTGRVVLAEEGRYNPERLPPSQFASVGAVLRVRLAEAPEADTPPRLKLELGPQGALVALDVQSRDIVALVGSYDAVPGSLDRARQAKRQPGSSFKPIVYAYALRAREVTAASVLDLKEKGHGVGEQPPYRMSVRNALAVSNNEAAEQLLLMDGPENVVAYARELGIESKLGPDLSLALGSYEVTPLEMAGAFAVFASGGFYEAPRLVAEVRAHGQPREPAPREPPRKVLEPSEAYLATSLLQSVVTSGTGQRARAIGYPIAGKTGTSNESKDAWFVGYSTDFVAAVWVGFDDALPLGEGELESGARTALPAFVSFMTAAHAGRPRTEFPKPPGVVEAPVDPDTGLLPRPGQTNTIVEEFLDGTVPVQVAPEPLLEPVPLPDNTQEMTYKPEPR